MRRVQFGLLSASLGMLLLSFATIGCGKADDDDDPPIKRRAKGKKGGDGGAKGPTLKAYKGTSNDATIEGKVTWDSSSDFSSETNALRAIMKNDRTYCLSGKEYETTQQMFRVGKNKGLGNVFIWIEPPPKHYFPVEKEQVAGLPKQVVISQPHCAFLPHASVVIVSCTNAKGETYPVQQLMIENDAKVGHNAVVKGGPDNDLGNQSVPVGGKIALSTLQPDPIRIGISCSVHGWMQAFVRAYDHPFAAVTSVGRKDKDYENLDDPNFGTYKIEGAPTGVKVKLYIWHEGDEKGLVSGLKTQEVTLKKGKNTINFTLSRK